MSHRLVSIATDTVPLDGVLMLPEEISRQPVLQMMHGNTMNFYSGILRFAAESLVAFGYPCLLYNRRGHDVLSNRDSREMEGGAFQTIAQAMEDNNFAREWLLGEGFESLVPVGHSHGGLLATAYAVEHEVPGLILLSAHRGGTDLMKHLAGRGLMAGESYEEITMHAQELVKSGRPDELLLVPGWWYVTSARTYLDYFESCPELLELVRHVRCPALYLIGDQEPHEIYPAAEFAARAQVQVDVSVIERCGHYYKGRESDCIEVVRRWLSERLSTP